MARLLSRIATNVTRLSLSARIPTGANAVKAGKTDAMRAVKCSIGINEFEPNAATRVNCAAENANKNAALSAGKNVALRSARIAASATVKKDELRTGRNGGLKIAKNAGPKIVLCAGTNAE